MNNRTLSKALRLSATFLTIFIVILGIPSLLLAYNWDWDQGHDCVQHEGEWGRWGYDGEWYADPCCYCKASPVFVRSGSFQEVYTDLVVKGVGPDLKVIRAYNGDDVSSGLLGYGWSITFGKRLQIVDDISTNDTYIIVKKPTGQKFSLYEQPDGSFITEGGPGVRLTLVRNENNTFTLTNFDGTREEYNTNGQLTSIIDRNDNQLSINYNYDTGCPQDASIASGRFLNVYFGANGKIESIEDYAGRNVQYYYDFDGNLTSVTDPLGNTTYYGYDSDHRLVSITDPRGNIVLTLNYDSDGQVSTYMENGETFTLTYNDGHTIKTDSQGNTWTCYFNEYGFVQKEVGPGGLSHLRQHNFITSSSLDHETYGAVEGENLSLTSGATASASSSWSSSYLPDRAIDGSLNTYWYSYYNTAHWFMVTFDESVDVSEISLPAQTGIYLPYVTDASLEFSNGYVQPVTLPNTEGFIYDDISIYLDSIQTGITWVRFNISQSTSYYVGIPEFEVWSPPSGGVTYYYTYDERGNRNRIINPLGDTTFFTYDSIFNQIETTTDPLGVVTKFEFDDNGNSTKVYRAFGTSEQIETSFTYDENGNVLSQTDPNGNTRTFTYDEYGNKLTDTDPLGNTTAFTYDDLGNITSITDAMGNITSLEYDLLGRLISLTDALGNSEAYSYDPNGNLLTQTDKNGNISSFEYDLFNRRVKTYNAIGDSTLQTYDNRGNLASKTDEEGNVVYLKYDPNGNLLIVNRKVGDSVDIIDGDDKVTRFGYNELNQKVSMVSPNDDTTKFGYDELGKKLYAVLASNDTIDYEYDPLGNLTGLIVANNYGYILQYDALSNLLNVSDTLGVIRSYGYDNMGNVVSETDFSGNTKQYIFNELGLLSSTVYPDSNTELYEYNNNGLIDAINYADGERIQFEYDALSRVIRSTNPLGGIIEASYDPMDNLLTLTDRLGNLTQYEYDVLNRLALITNPEGSTKSMVYNSKGLTELLIDFNGDSSRFEYNELGQLAHQDVKGSEYDANYEYDINGNLIRAENSFAVVEFVCDEIGRILEERINGVGISYNHNIPDNKKTITYPNGRIVEYEFDLRDRLTRIIDENQNLIADYTHNPANKVTNISLGNGSTTSYSYNLNNWLESYTHVNGADTLLDFEYSYNIDRKLSKINSNHDPLKSQTFGYDEVQRLTDFKEGQLVNDEIPTPEKQISYELDIMSNWVSLTIDDTTQNRTVNSLNAYQSVGNINYIYDNNGNLIDDGLLNYHYDFHNCLVRVEDIATGVNIVEFQYDPFSRRIAKIIDDDTTRYHYDRRFRIVEEISDESNISYVWGSGQDRLVSLRYEGQDYYAAPSPRGDILMFTDQNGTPIEYYNYDPYGNFRISDANNNTIEQSQIGNSFGFACKYYDHEINSYYFRARYYSPYLGRFLSTDLAGFVSSFNLYEYAISDPILLVDNFGLKECAIENTFGIDLEGPIQNVLGKALKIFGLNFKIGGGVEFTIKNCSEECCVASTGEWKTETFNDYSASAGLSLTFGGWIPGFSIPIPGTDDGVGVRADIIFEIKGSAKYECEIAIYDCIKSCDPSGCLKLSGTLSLGAGAQIGEEDFGMEIYIKGDATLSGEGCMDNIGLSLEACLSGEMYLKAKIELWIFSFGKKIVLLSGKVCSGDKEPWYVHKWQ